MVDAGELDRRVRLRRLVETTGRGNSPVATWSTIATVWAKRTPLRDTERLASKQVQAATTDRFLVRWSAVVASLTARDRLVDVGTGEEFEISGLKEVGRREGREITATARVDGGGL